MPNPNPFIPANERPDLLSGIVTCFYYTTLFACPIRWCLRLFCVVFSLAWCLPGAENLDDGDGTTTGGKWIQDGQNGIFAVLR
jgi:hypothetical protein